MGPKQRLVCSTTNGHYPPINGPKPPKLLTKPTKWVNVHVAKAKEKGKCTRAK